MAELTKDDIKETLGFIGGVQRFLGVFGKAEVAVAVLGQLKAFTDSLTAKEEKLREEVGRLEARKGFLGDEWEKAKKEIAAFRDKGLRDAEAEIGIYGADLRMKAEADRDGIVAETGLLAAKEIEIAKVIVGLSKDRDDITEDIKSLRKSQTVEQSRLDAILAQIADLKSRL